ncbi:hypothetical protein FIBSPDRAFT_852480 [Athelia psychrophila]|uniref:Uncharacterized protein n=1 Tax=Athelia psychrophila TaxID=1759441 RepID=A0A166RXL1_9AGAM|nr:hypothetical protein FIBSPDRAFT_852480 [Fibularhizoctonia sp. CBS 109695]
MCEIACHAGHSRKGMPLAIALSSTTTIHHVFNPHLCSTQPFARVLRKLACRVNARLKRARAARGSRQH